MRDIDVYNIGTSPEQLQSALVNLRADFDAHIHDGSSSRAFETIKVQTISAEVVLIKKTSYTDPASGIWMGILNGTMKMKLGNATNFVQFDGTTLSISGAISAGTITGATIIGGIIETSTTGQRIVIDSASNSLKFFDSAGQVIGIGTDAGKAISMSLTSGTGTGVLITSGFAGVGFSYTTTDDSVQAIGLDLSVTQGTGANSLPAIRVVYGGTAPLMDGTVIGTGKGIQISRSVGSGTANLLSLISSSSTAGTMLDVTRTGVGVITAMNIDHSTSSTSINTGIQMTLGSGTSSLCYAFRFNGSEVVNASVGGSQNYKIRISIGGTDYFIPCNTA